MSAQGALTLPHVPALVDLRMLPFPSHLFRVRRESGLGTGLRRLHVLERLLALLRRGVNNLLLQTQDAGL